MGIQLDEIMQRIRENVSARYDLVVAIARGGILPGYLVSRYLDLPLEIISINFRNDSNQAQHQRPVLLRPLAFDPKGKRILLVDDVSNSRATLQKAKTLLNGTEITTLVISGDADISLYGPHDRCIHWPWD